MDLRKALVVGIDNYPTSPLRGCINDANAVASILKTNGNGSPNFDVRVCPDVRKRSDLRSLIRETFDGANDTCLFYFSGHGTSSVRGSFIVTPDYGPNDEGVSMDEILEAANGSRSSNRVVILDCCYSGAFGSPGMIGGDKALIADGVSILTACKNDEASVEIGGHGVFTSLLLAALEGGAADLTGHITPGSVYAYVDRALGPWNQRPVFKTNTSRFTPLRRVAPQVRPETLRRIVDYFQDPQEEYVLDPSYEDTNSPKVEHEVVEPYANAKNVAIFKDLQRMQSVGLVVPVGEDYMYFAAMHSKSCRLTALGYHYWKLAKNGRL
jgi:uncharacterized caspase-like protein